MSESSSDAALKQPVSSEEEREWTVDDIEVLYRDESIIVVNKPSGLIVHRGWANDSVVVMTLVRKIVQKRVFPVHRLDRGTSGVLVFALSSEVASSIGKMLTERSISKRYIALVCGTPDPAFQVDKPLTRKKDGPRVPSCTLVRRLFAMEYYAIVEAVPLTGRLHQLRRHLHHVDHAIIGDKKHGYRWKNNFNREKYGVERVALHAWALSMKHPVDGRSMVFTAPLPQDLMGPFEKMGIPQRVWDDLYAEPTHPWVDAFSFTYEPQSGR